MRFVAFVVICGFVTLSAKSQAQTNTRTSVRAWFEDGSGIEIYTATTGPTQTLSTQQRGVIGIYYDRQVRLVVDRNDNVLFGYYLDGKHSTTPNAEFIRISPIDPVFSSRRYIKAAGPIPTVDTVREFPAVKIGQVITLDILFNPATGEKVYEVIRPLTDPSPAGPNRPVVTAGGVGDQLSLKEITLRVNGQNIAAPASWMLGGAARINVPEYGLFIISASDPKNPLFRATAQINRRTISWNTDRGRVEITSKTNILASSETATIWVYQDPNYKSADSPATVGLQTADSVDWLLPRKE